MVLNGAVEPDVQPFEDTEAEVRADEERRAVGEASDLHIEAPLPESVCHTVGERKPVRVVRL
jgi:hypothetical protein